MRQAWIVQVFADYKLTQLAIRYDMTGNVSRRLGTFSYNREEKANPELKRITESLLSGHVLRVEISGAETRMGAEENGMICQRAFVAFH